MILPLPQRIATQNDLQTEAEPRAATNGTGAPDRDEGTNSVMASAHVMPRPHVARKLSLPPLDELSLARNAHLCALQRVIATGTGAGDDLVEDMRAFERAAWQLWRAARGAA